MNTQDWNDTIDAYLAGKLSDTEKASFENAVATNNELAMELEIFRLENTAKELLIEEDLRTQMDEWESNLPADFDRPNANSDKKNGNGFRWGGLGLLVIAIGAAAWWFLSKPADNETNTLPTRQPTLRTEEYVPADSDRPVATEETAPTDNTDSREQPADKTPTRRQNQSSNRELLAMAETMYEPYTFSDVRSGSEDPASQTLVEQAAVAYEAKDFSKVVTLLATPEEDDRTEALKMRAHAYFQLKSYNKAAADFQELTNSFSYKYDAQWNLLLSYLALSPQRQADFDTLLKEITGNVDHPFNSQAKTLESKLKNK